MPRLDLHEGEEVEFKRQRTDQALEDLAAFANAQGGTLFIGVEDDGAVVGVADPEAEMQRIANTVASRLGLTPSVRRQEIGGREIIAVHVEPARGVVGHNGRYRTRVGSTNRDLSPEELGRLVLRRSGQSWDALPSALGADQIAHSALARFGDLARRRLPEIDPSERERLLQNPGLLRDGRLTNAAVLLFADRPQDLFPDARPALDKTRHRGPDRPRRHLPQRPLPRPQGRLHPGQPSIQYLRLGRRAAVRGQALEVRLPAHAAEIWMSLLGCVSVMRWRPAG